MYTKVKRAKQSCEDCKKDKKKCFGGENGVKSCNRCNYIRSQERKFCSFVKGLAPLRGHCENQPEIENPNGDISYSQNVLEAPSTDNNFP
ncbi:19476_t:CDS:2, partial [Cetraspora pellucida]